MRVSGYIRQRMLQYALNIPIFLYSRRKGRGRSLYTKERNRNFYQPLLKEIERQFNQADGNELFYSSKGDLPKIHAVHSSSALVVNLFAYWFHNPIPIAAACRLCSSRTRRPMIMEFEVKLPIRDDFPRAPNIDVLFRVEDDPRFQAFAVESKFSEPFTGRSHGGLNPAYLDQDLWVNLSNLRQFATQLSQRYHIFKYLHAAQLLKHILGLRNAFGKRFKLLYLYYDAFGQEGAMHQEEIMRFRQVARLDRVWFYALSHQELINHLADHYRDSHQKYIHYITSRYF